MGVIDCNRSYYFLLGDDWLKFVKAEASWVNGKRYFTRRNGVAVMLGRGTEQEDTNDEDETTETTMTIYHPSMSLMLRKKTKSSPSESNPLKCQTCMCVPSRRSRAPSLSMVLRWT